MLDLSTSQLVQLVAALTAGIILYCIVLIFPEAIIIRIVILLIPFQIISSRYGSLNMVVTYLLGIALIFKRKLDIITPAMA